jgi:protein TonB
MFEEGLGRAIVASVVIHVGVLAFAFSPPSSPAPAPPAPAELTFFTALPAPPPPPPAAATVTARALSEPKVQPRKKPAARVPVPDLRTEVPEPEAVAETSAVPEPSVPAVSSPEPGAASAEGSPGGAPGGKVGGTPGGTGTRAGETGAVAFGDGMTAPRRLSGREIAYTREAIEAQVEGLMIVQCVIEVDGRLSRCGVLKSVPLMEPTVLEALQTWRFEPVTLRGKPVAVKYNVPIRLVLPKR